MPGGQISDVGARDGEHRLHVAAPGVSDVAEGHHTVHSRATAARVPGIIAERLLSLHGLSLYACNESFIYNATAFIYNTIGVEAL